MVVPYKHDSSLEGLDVEARAELMKLATQIISILGKVYHVQGLNMGINVGEAAGAGITEHVHLHVVLYECECKRAALGGPNYRR